jgi:chromate reductase, NAD(P)H dehydrogenase (quinone)
MLGDRAWLRAFVASVVQVLLVSGSLRHESTNTAALRSVLRWAPHGVEGALYEGMASLPAFNPDLDRDPLPPAVADLRTRIRDADAVVFSTPEYAGDLPGAFKNLLDWTVGDDQPGSIDTKPVAWVNVSPRGATHAHDSLRRVLGYVGAHIVESACIETPVTSDMVGMNGLVDDPEVLQRLAHALEVLTGAVDPARA